jgi:DNA-binding NarL/FixJ family response regulator
MNILVVDDHPIVQKGLKLLLETETGWCVIGQAADGATALRCVSDLRPAVAIVDLNLPDSSGIELIEPIKSRSPETRVIILSMHMNDFYIKAARRNGADAYVSKHVAENEIVNAVKAVTSGRSYPEHFGTDPDDRHCARDKNTPAAGSVLTVRESQVLHVLASGGQNKDVAQLLGISVRTAEKHRGSIMRKLNLKNHAELIHFALQSKIIDLPKPVSLS